MVEPGLGRNRRIISSCFRLKERKCKVNRPRYAIRELIWQSRQPVEPAVDADGREDGIRPPISDRGDERMANSGGEGKALEKITALPCPLARALCAYCANRFRYSAELTKPSTIRRESAGLASRALTQSRYKASGSRRKYPKYSITTNA
jgi:hypothetical protein